MIDWSAYFYYDKSSPSCLRWKVSRFVGKGLLQERVKPGDIAGCPSRGYYLVRLDNVLHRVHRIIWEIHFGEIPIGHVVDHLDGNARNNDADNLRATTNKINSRNAKMKRNNKTGINGVYYVKNREYEYMVAQVSGDDGRQTKSFSILKLGREEATKQATAHHIKLVGELNKQGAGYSGRHGSGN